MTNYHILLPPSEGKIDGGYQKYNEAKKHNHFQDLEKDRKYLLDNLIGFINQSTELELKKLFAVKSNITETINLLQNFDQKLTLPAIERYSGVMFQAINYQSLNIDQKNRANQSIIFIDALFGLLYPLDLIPNYKLSITAKFNNFKIDNYWKNKLKTILDQLLKNKITLDVLPQAHRKAINFNYQNQYLINFFEVKNGKIQNAGHMSKKLKGEFIRYILNFDEINLEILYNFSHSDGYKYNEDLSSKNEIIFLKS